MTRVLPSNPDIQKLKKHAKQLLKALRANNEDELHIEALEFVSLYHPKPKSFVGLRDAQLTVARSYGYRDWNELKQAVEVARINALSLAEQAAIFVRLGCVQYNGGDQSIYYERAERLLEKTPAIASFDLFSAIVAHDTVVVASLIRSDPERATKPGGPMDWPPLLYATYSRIPEPDGKRQSIAMVRLLLDNGADPNAHVYLHDIYRFTALTGVMGEGEMGLEHQPPHQYSNELATMLLDAGASPNEGQGLYNTMFANNSSAWVKLLVRYGLSAAHRINWDTGEDAPTCFDFLLGHAAKNGLTDRIELLLDLGADVDFVDGYENRPVHTLAILKGHIEAARALSRRGAKREELGAEDKMRVAISSDDWPEAKLLLENHSELKAEPDLLHHTIGCGTEQMMWRLLDAGFDINGTDAGGMTILHQFAWDDEVAMVNRLIERGARTDIRDIHHHSTPLGHAAFNASMEVVSLLADSSTDIMDTVCCARPERVAALLDANPALVDHRSPGGHTLLHLVGIWLDEEADEASCALIIDDLIGRGLNVNLTSEDGKTPLDMAISRGNGVMTSLLEACGGMRAS